MMLKPTNNQLIAKYDKLEKKYLKATNVDFKLKTQKELIHIEDELHRRKNNCRVQEMKHDVMEVAEE